jgi:predicted nucleic acid-binding protein
MLPRLYQIITITPQVYDEVAVKGSGLPGSAEVAASKWIIVKPVHNPEDLAAEQRRYGLAIGELSAVVLGRELNADLVLIDEIKARKAAQERGLAVLGCVGAACIARCAVGLLKAPARPAVPANATSRSRRRSSMTPSRRARSRRPHASG